MNLPFTKVIHPAASQPDAKSHRQLARAAIALVVFDGPFLRAVMIRRNHRCPAEKCVDSVWNDCKK
jgi:hypothetical protein